MDTIINILNFDNYHLLLNFLFFLIGVAVLVKGSDFFIDSAIFFAKKFHVSEIIIGLTLVSIGTSLPEFAANINSAIKARSAIAIGNVTGSNITNIGLVIAISILIIGSIKVPKKMLKRDMLFMIGVTCLLLVFSYFFDGKTFKINRIESGIMIVLLIIYIIYLFKFNKETVDKKKSDHEELKVKKMWAAILLLFFGGISIYAGSELMIRNVISISGKLNISDGVIGATIVALATSFPELSVTIIGVIKKKSDISLGNIVGSNIFNILGVLGVTGLIRNINITTTINDKLVPDKQMLFWTLPFTLIIGLLLLIFMLINKKLGRIKAIVLLLFYICFIVFNFVGINLWFL